MSAPKTVLLISNTAWSILVFRGRLIAHLVNSGFRVIAVAPPDPAVADIQNLGAEFIPLYMDNKGINPIKDLKLIVDFWRLIRRLKPELAITYTIKPIIYFAIAASFNRVKVISVVCGLGSAFTRVRLVTVIAQILYRYSQRKVDKIFLLNKDDYELFLKRKLAPPEILNLLPGEGIDLSYFSPLPENEIKQSSNLKFLLVGRILWDKGVGEFICAARAMLKEFDNVEFWLLGSTDAANPSAVDPDVVKSWVKDGTVSYLGEVTDVRGIMNSASIVVLPSYREGMSMALLEAAALGKPLIASDVPGCREIVIDGVSGLLCKPRDVLSLMKSMETMMGFSPEFRKQMGEKGRRHVASHFGDATVLNIYDNAIAELVNSECP